MSIIKDVAFIGIGQAGGNICSQFELQGHTVLYINTSQEDLDTLGDAQNKHHVAGGEGTAKNRELSKELISNNFNAIDKVIDEKIKEEFIFVVFSSAGGTGSGASPTLMEYLKNNYPKRCICGVTILPKTEESLRAQGNTYECFQELRRLYDETESMNESKCGALFIIDNNRFKDKMQLNNAFVGLLEDVLLVPDSKDIRGTIDAADVKETLRSSGCAIISKMSPESMINELNDSLNKSIFAPLESDEMVEYILLSMISAIDIDALKKKTGIPVDIYQGYNTKQTLCVLSGLSFPKTRLDGIEQQAMLLKEHRQKSLSQKAVIQEKTLDLGIEKTDKLSQSKTEMTRDEIREKAFAKFRKK